MQEFLERFPGWLEDAFSLACQDMDLDQNDVDKTLLQFVIVDSDPFGDPDAFNASKNASVVVSGYKSDGRILLIFFAQPIANGLDPQDSLHHECIHILHRYLLDKKSYRTYPKWIHEGLAMWFSHEKERRVERELLLHKTADKLIERFNGLEDTVEQRHGSSDYLEDLFAIEFLAEQGGEGAVKRFNQDMLRGRNFRESISDISGLDWVAYKKAARTFAEEAIKGMVTDVHREYVAVSSLLDTPDAFEQKAESFLKQAPSRLYQRNLEMDRIRAFYKAGKIEETIALGDAFLAVKDPPVSYLEDNVLMIMGVCYQQQRNDKGIIKVYSRLCTQYPHSSSFSPAWYLAWANSLRNEKRIPEALELAKKSLRQFPQQRQVTTLTRLIELMETNQ